MKELSFEKMENVNGGRMLEAGCIFGGLALCLLTDGAFAFAFSLTVHACVLYLASETPV
jgi:acyl-CoA hydrolase